MSERGYLSIGEVLDLLKGEFPDVTISKIRFLESQGLLEPERTASGYRKFYDPDVDRLRFILQQQKEKYLPLKVIRGQLGGETGSAVHASESTGPPLSTTDGDPDFDGAVATGSYGSGDGYVDGGLDAASMVHAQGRHPTAFPRVPRVLAPRAPRRADAPSAPVVAGRGTSGTASTPAPEPPVGHRASQQPSPTSRVLPGVPAVDPARVEADTAAPVAPGALGLPGAARAEPVAPPAVVPAESTSPVAVPAAEGSARSAALLAGGGTGVSMNLEELAAAAGLAVESIRQLEQFGLVVGRGVFSQMYYDEEALLVARVAAGFLAFGVEPRHLRIYKTSAEREAGLFEQVVTPQLRRRNPEARTTALASLAELARLGEQLRAVTVRQVLRAAIDAK